MGFIAARLGYFVCYVADKAALRSLFWALATACWVAMFVLVA